MSTFLVLLVGALIVVAALMTVTQRNPIHAALSMLVAQPPPDPATSAWRIFNGEGIRWGGIWIDNFDGHWLVQTRKGHFPEPFRDAVPDQAKSLWWKRREKAVRGKPEWIAGERLLEPIVVEENGVRFLVDFHAGYSQGIFLDQRENRARILERVRPEQRILNCFAYTGAFSVVAARAGGITTSLDLSKPYLEWAKRNFEANEIDPADQFFCKGDVFEWLRSFRRQERRFHGVILDPPTFSRNEKGKVFRADKDYSELVRLAAGVLEEEAWLLCSANTHSMAAAEFEIVVRDGVKLGRRIPSAIESFPMPPEFGNENYLKSVWVEVA